MTANLSPTIKKERDSNFELLRLLAMWFILIYHFVSFFVAKSDGSPLFRAVQMPLHVAVICFVLISGYYHIKTSLRGLCKLLFPLIIIYLPFTAYEYFTGGGAILKTFCFSLSPHIGILGLMLSCF